jgi:hypothetical protein
VNEQEAPHDDYMKRQTAAVRERLGSNNLLTRYKEKKEAEADADE